MIQKMMSSAGKFYQKYNKINPISKTQREKMYHSFERMNTSIKIKKNTNSAKFSPFNTQSRQSRHSYLLRVTLQPNTKTNYQVNYTPTQRRDRIATIDKAPFKRIIGPVHDTNYQIYPPPKLTGRCSASLQQSTKPKLLTPTDIQKWKNTHSNIDFAKQLNPQRLSKQHKQLKNQSDEPPQKCIRQQSNFNNFNNLSIAPKSSRSHDFNSTSGHQYLSHIFSRDIQPQYNLVNSKQDKIKKSMRGPKGQLRFYLFRNSIKTRIDRADPNWLQTLDYSADIKDQNRTRKNSAIDFELMAKRATNQVHSRYPIRQSLRIQAPNNKLE